jgi:hypothetical protein
MRLRSDAARARFAQMAKRDGDPSRMLKEKAKKLTFCKNEAQMSPQREQQRPLSTGRQAERQGRSVACAAPNSGEVGRLREGWDGVVEGAGQENRRRD